MSTLSEWLWGALLGSSIIMLFVLVMRVPVRRGIGPQLGYWLWLLPAVRMVVPPLPADLFGGIAAAAGAGATWSVLVVGPRTSGLWRDASVAHWPIGEMLLAAWLAGALMVLGVHVGRHVRFRRRVLATATSLGRHGTIQIVATDVDGPLAFGILRPYVAVPHDFGDRYTATERKLALAHECAHHARGDLIANWASLAMLAVHWWNPLAWVAVRAFRDDQEFAVDAHVLALCDPTERPDYARLLAKAAGLGGLPVCNLNARSNLKRRLMMFAMRPTTKGRLIFGGGGLMALAATVLAATMSVGSAAAPATGRQAVTIGVKPDGAGGYALIVGGTSMAPGSHLVNATLPTDFAAAGGCDLKPSAEPNAMVIKGFGDVRTYTVMCASAKPAPVRATLAEGLASLKKMRGMIAAQTQPSFPEAERRHALGAVDRSIREVEGTLARMK